MKFTDSVANFTINDIIYFPEQMKANQLGQEKALPLTKRSTSAGQKDYQILGTLGQGAYGCVSLAERNGKIYALKRIEKKKLAREKKQYQAFVEKQLLRKIDHPGIIKLVKCFQESKYLNYVLEYCHGGDFISYLRTNHKLFTQEMRVFYVAEIVSILQYIHTVGITHRDLKPENIMLSKEGHLKLIDFGTAEISRCTIVDESFKDDIQKQKKSIQKKSSQDPTEEDNEEQEASPRKRKSTFVGTCFYLSPELLQHNICQAPSDLWALGCIIYQLYYLQPPFKAGNEYQLFQKIKTAEINFPKNQYITEEAIDLIKRLLVKIPEDRLGSNQKEGLKWKDLKSHPYFKNVDFSNLFGQQVPYLKQEQPNKLQHQYKLDKIKSEIQADHEYLFMNKDENICAGVVERKSFGSFSPEYLILKKNFKLVKIKLNQQQQRKLLVTPISNDKVAQLIDDTKFRAIIDECKVTIRTSDAKKWVQILNEEFMKEKKLREGKE